MCNHLFTTYFNQSAERARRLSHETDHEAVHLAAPLDPDQPDQEGNLPSQDATVNPLVRGAQYRLNPAFPAYSPRRNLPVYQKDGVSEKSSEGCSKHYGQVSCRTGLFLVTCLEHQKIGLFRPVF